MKHFLAAFAVLAALLLPGAPAAAQDFGGDPSALQARAERGDAAAQFHMGVVHLLGQGVPQDFPEAARYYRLAAEQGDAFAQHSLGVMYREGLGVPQSDVRAHMWFNLAAAQGHEAVARYRDTVAERMTPEQLAEAQDLVSEWMANQGE